ncbi:hypothetical protein KCA24_33130, partial [Escherichia coli]|nr:hypothetical protein [Escherichia coli]
CLSPNGGPEREPTRECGEGSEGGKGHGGGGGFGMGAKALEDRGLWGFFPGETIGIESCLTSNIQTSTVAELAAHPLKTFLEHGIRAGINTDDPGVQGVDIIHEYTVAAPAAGLSREQIRQARFMGLEMVSLGQGEKAPVGKKALRRKKNGWGKLTPPFFTQGQKIAGFWG